MRNDKKRILDTLKSINSRGYDPYNKADCLGWMYSLKWNDDCRRSEFNANRHMSQKEIARWP